MTTDLNRDARAKQITMLAAINELIPAGSRTSIDVRTGSASDHEIRVHMLTGNAPDTAAALGLDLVGAEASPYGEREIHVGWTWSGTFEQDYVESRVTLVAGTFFPVCPVETIGATS